MNVYKAVNFKEALWSGTTRPWLVGVLVEDEHHQSFVVKAFKAETLTQYNAVAHEVVANELAQLLDLSVPEKAWIKFEDNFIAGLPEELRDKVKTGFIDKRPKFGTAFIEKSMTYSSGSLLNTLEEWEYENIYAFDNLIFNGDRNRRKPNILLNKNNYYLIDHELIFNGLSEKSISDLEALHTKFQYNNHIFYPVLQRRKDKSRLFETFEESLRSLNIRDLERVFSVLEVCGYTYTNHTTFLHYLRYIKANSRKFVKTLQGQFT